MGLIQAIQVPLLAVNDTFLTVAEVKYKTGDRVRKGDCLMVFETSKTTYEVEAEQDGYIEVICEAGNDYEVNAIVANLYDSPDFPAVLAQPQAPSVLPTKASIPERPGTGAAALTNNWTGDTLFSEAALRMMEAYGLSPANFQGRSFVNREAVLASLAGGATQENKQAGVMPVEAKEAVSLPVDPAKVSLQKLSKQKRTEIQFLSAVQSAGLTSTLTMEVNAEGLPGRVAASLKMLKQSFLPLIIYEVSRLLKHYPLLNAYYTPEGIAVYNDVNIGFAIDLDKGLKVVKVPRADQQSVHDIESAIVHLSGQYLDDKLTLDDISDISFTITDLSAEGIGAFVPLVNYLNSAILGVGALNKKQNSFTLSMTFDHRVTEGKLVARFLTDLKERIESFAGLDKEGWVSGIHCASCLKPLKEDLSGLGFVKAINMKGEEQFICQTCFKGF